MKDKDSDKGEYRSKVDVRSAVDGRRELLPRAREVIEHRDSNRQNAWQLQSTRTSTLSHWQRHTGKLLSPMLIGADCGHDALSLM